MPSFYERFRERSAELQSLLSVGLDPDPALIPPEYEGINGIARFLSDVISATAEYAVAYKPNLAFYESLGPKGMQLFEKTIEVIHSKAPGALIIADAKRGDIGNTASHYAKAYFETYNCDAITLNPYMGLDTLEPFLTYEDKAAMVLGLTSNPGSALFQAKSTPPLYELVARSAHELNQHFGNVWLVVGATNEPEMMQKIRENAPEVPFLVPGIGAQGGSMENTLAVSSFNQLINASRTILYSARTKSEVKQKAAESASAIVDLIRSGLAALQNSPGSSPAPSSEEAL